MNKPRVFADFHNTDAKGRARLNCAGTIANLERQGIALQAGQSLSIYSEELEVEGVVQYSEEEKLWTAVIDWNAIQEVEPVTSQLTIQDIIREIKKKSKGGGYIYRGERKCNPKVSSKLYRDFEIETGNFNIDLVEKEMLAAAKKHTGDLPQDFRLDVMAPPNVITALTEEARDFEILTEIQHYGGKTNLIDFTTDYFIALFFACDGRYDEDGRVILQKRDEISDMIAPPRNPRHRVIVKKSVFIRPPRGFIEPEESDIVTIPANLKEPLLQHLRDYHGISTEVIYNDIHGFIRNQNIHGDAYTHFYRGFACQNRANEAPTPEEKQWQYEEAISHFTKAIKLKPDSAEAYINRGIAYYKKNDFDNAIKDFVKAIQLKPDSAEAYFNRGNAYDKKAQFDNAIRDYTEAIRLNPDDVRTYYNRGNTYYEKGDFDNAINDYTEAIRLNPDLAEAHHNRGVFYVKKGEFDNAINDYTKAIELKSDYADAYHNRGEARLHLQEWEKAKSDLITAKEMDVYIIAAFHNDCENVEDFEQKTGIQLPEDIAELLTPPTA
ncbi:tetratricopeptide repeat protein [Candidatus Poribacteria bacterium]|nr:tetratricopeptide repeat protein [Candidatus Poribacteria bacterium]MYA57521.1 tetratricopeptide repeat protein [Candidatus Poribacteria bacterium]